ncbi:M14 family metallopeptidase [Prolixibacteraceae bacterium Z1-6]|uniref:M14 family metallopeptidase n=1 Tax=Draconibacterium aestuarii TaxID=2998507 RepID=A0A9X3FIL0_9BACT|nr:M14 family metallopeptidase [Prolixibacteraceae bacterium Z1-6]
MLKKLLHMLLSGFLLFSVNQLTAQSKSDFIQYHTNDEIQQILKKYTNRKTTLHTIAESPGGNAVTVLEIGSDLKDVPAIFVGANFEGNVPLATEGALYLAKMLLDSAAYTQKVKWYIMPQPNPDAATGYFTDVKYGRTVNDYPVNNDADDALNEDGFDDLNGDGFITQMRIKDPEGTYIISKDNALVMKKADTKKGERGEYKIYSEGIDNDEDGQYNEDGEGGINVGIAFPHLFPRAQSEAGMYAGQTPEVYGIMRFIYDHPEIAMVYTIGSSNFCIEPPVGGRKGDANLDKIKIPNRYGRMFGIDVSRTYTMEEVIEMFKANVPAEMEITPSVVAGMVGLGAAVNPLDDDLIFYKKFSEEYKKFLEEKNFNLETLPPSPAKDGSFELWAYYHLGVPSFSMNLFSIPKEKVEKKDDNEVPSENKEEERESEISEKDKALFAYSEKEWEDSGFVKWEKVNHPKLGQIEVGGFIPYLETTPKAEKIEELVGAQIPWLLQLSNKLPDITIEDYKITQKGSGIYTLELFVANNGELGYPISIGQRNNQPAPVIIVLNGDVELLQGKNRTPLGSVGAHQIRKLTWLIKTTPAPPNVTVKIESVVFKNEVKQINIGG